VRAESVIHAQLNGVGQASLLEEWKPGQCCLHVGSVVCDQRNRDDVLLLQLGHDRLKLGDRPLRRHGFAGDACNDERRKAVNQTNDGQVLVPNCPAVDRNGAGFATPQLKLLNLALVCVLDDACAKGLGAVRQKRVRGLKAFVFTPLQRSGVQQHGVKLHAFGLHLLHLQVDLWLALVVRLAPFFNELMVLVNLMPGLQVAGVVGGSG
jgi:hypothetical protein